jgi:hypothetical protein
MGKSVSQPAEEEQTATATVTREKKLQAAIDLALFEALSSRHEKPSVSARRNLSRTDSSHVNEASDHVMDGWASFRRCSPAPEILTLHDDFCRR